MMMGDSGDHPVLRLKDSCVNDPWSSSKSGHNPVVMTSASVGKSSSNINLNGIKLEGSGGALGEDQVEFLTGSHSKNFKVAVDIMIRWYRAFGGSVRAEDLGNFINCFMEEIGRMQPAGLKQGNKGYLVNLDAFCCPECFGVLIDPVTVQCGHSYCRKCLQKERVGGSCKRCRHVLTAVDITKCKLNVLLGSLVEKWWANDLAAAKARSEGNILFEANEGEKSLAKYSQALSLVPTDHLTLGNLSHVLLSLGRSEEALTRIDSAIKNSPYWGKGYFRKSAVLISLGRYEEAFVSLAICAALVILGKPHADPTVTPVKNELLKVLHRMFLTSAGGSSRNSSIRRHSSELSANPYPTKQYSNLRGNSEMGTESDCSSLEDGGSDLESVQLSQRKRNCSSESKLKSKLSPLNNSSTAGHQAQAVRIQRLFDRALQDVKRKYGELVEKSGGDRTVRIGRQANPAAVSASDAECTLCYRLLHQPVTTVCGHTYCRSCLERSMDHSPMCPLCKTSLEDCMGHRKHATNQFIETAIIQFLPKEYAERVQQHLEDMAEGAVEDRQDEFEIAIFVCTMAFPNVPCPLHVFEPKYRLMIRRCMESGARRFGMCSYVQDGEYNYADVGTLLEIQNVQYFPDGRSVVDTIGRRRFKVLSKSVKDGYNVARIQILRDRNIDPEAVPQVQAIHNQVYREAKDWLESISQVLRQRIVTHFGTMPAPEENWMGTTDGPAWIWWLLAILPIVTKVQLAILGMTSLQKRLETIQKLLRYVSTKQM